MVYAGRRKWIPEKVDISTFLKGVIRSLFSHLIESARHQTTIYGLLDEDIKSYNPIDNNLPESRLFEEDIKESLWKIAGDDEIKKSVLQGLIQGKKRKEIAQESSLSLSSIDRIIREFRNLLYKQLKEN